MRVYWMLRGGESAEIYDGSEATAKEKALVYRVGVERLIQCEVKVVRSPGKPKLINNDSKIKSVDIPANGALFIEAVGTHGCAFGWFETV